MLRRIAIASVAAVAAGAIATGPAGAAFPGENGPIFFERSGGLWRISQFGFGDGKRLLRKPGLRAPAVSPDGRKVAFSARGRRGIDVFVYDVARDKLRNVTGRLRACRGEREPSWAPSGKRLAFECGRAGIFTVSTRGKRLRRVTRRGFEPAWSPSGKRIAFLTPRGRVALVRAAGGHRRVLVRGGDGWQQLDWSPKGGELVVEGDRAIHRMSTKIGAVTAPLIEGRVSDPVFSPDGRRIAYVSSDRGREIWSATRNGDDRRRLTSGGTERAPSWARD